MGFISLASVTQLYAFYYRPNPPLPSNSGWLLYSPRKEFGRLGVGTRSKAWRFTDINKDYSVREASLCSGSRLLMASHNFSSVLHTLPCWLSRPRSAIRRCNTLQNIEASVGYLHSATYTGQTTCVAMCG